MLIYYINKKGYNMLTKNQQDLFDSLNILALEKESFTSSEQKFLNRYIVKSFSYNLASYSEFQKKHAKESRGTAFVFDKDTNEWSMFCRAYKKFFNLGEGEPVKDYIQKNPKIVTSYEKLDGSLILVGRINETLITKSKTTIDSPHAKKAQKLIDSNRNLKKLCNKLIDSNKTPVFELIGPSNQIVLRYEKEELVYLGAVDMETGVEEVLKDYEQREIQKNYPDLRFAKQYNYKWEDLLEIKNNSKEMIEGFVVKTELEFVKVKTQKYINLHHTNTNLNSIKNLVILILEDDLDDLIGLHRDKQENIDYILKTQEKVINKYNHMVASVEANFSNFKDLERKEFAMKVSKTNKEYMPLLMNLYNGKLIDYKEFFMKRKMYEEGN
jgi:T4 RnlA family RNA ligase